MNTKKLTKSDMQKYETTRKLTAELIEKANNSCFNCVNAEANQNIGELTKTQKIAMRILIQKHFDAICALLCIDDKDANVVDTPYRVAKMWVEEVMAGRFTKAPKIASFENVNNYDGMCIVKCSVKSMCSHHFVPFIGTCYVGFIAEPDKPLIGLSKINRIVDWFARRPQLQENLTKQIADYLVKTLNVENIAVAIVAEHFCVKWRGINDDQGSMESNVLYGNFKKPEIRQEFLNSIRKES